MILPSGFCSRGRSNSPPGMWCTVRQPCWSIVCGNGVHEFTLDPLIGAFVLSKENIQMPGQGSYYSVNEANRESFPEEYCKYIDEPAQRQSQEDLQLAVHRLDGRGCPSHADARRACFSILRPKIILTGSCGCSMRRIRSRFLSSRRAAWRSTDRNGSWTSSRTVSIRGRLSFAEVGGRWRRLSNWRVRSISRCSVLDAGILQRGGVCVISAAVLRWRGMFVDRVTIYCEAGDGGERVPLLPPGGPMFRAAGRMAAMAVGAGMSSSRRSETSAR